MKKRIISLLFSAVMLFSLLPTTAFAGNDSIELSDHAKMLLEKVTEYTGDTQEEAIKAVADYLADPACYDDLFEEGFDWTGEDAIRAANALFYIALLKTAFCLNGFATMQNAGFDELVTTIEELPPVTYELVDLFDAVEAEDYVNVVTLASQVGEDSYALYAKVFGEESEEVTEADFLTAFKTYVTDTSVSGDLFNNTKKASEQYAAYVAELCGVTDSESLSKFRQYADDWAEDEGNRYMLNYYGNLLSEDEFSALQEGEKEDYINRTLTGACLSFFDSLLENHFAKHGEHFSLETAEESFGDIMRASLDTMVAHKESMINLINALQEPDEDEKYSYIYGYLGELIEALSENKCIGWDTYTDLYTDWDNLYLAMQGEDVVTSAFEVTDSGSNREIRLLKDISCARLETRNKTLLVKSGKSIILDLNGHKLNRNLKAAAENGSVITVQGGASLTVQDSSTGKTGKITGGNNSTQNMFSTGTAGGVYVDMGGTFTMNGGTICNNVGTYGGGVFVNVAGTFTMNDGKISNNSVIAKPGRAGGGVYVNGATFTMNDGTISDNDAPQGGGVFLTTGGTFDMHNGKISDNSATEFGGGVAVMLSSTFNMSGGAVSGNTVTTTYSERGGGVYAELGDLIVGGDAKITGNTKVSGDSTTPNNVYLGNNTITLAADDNAPKEGMCIGVTTEDEPSIGNPVTFTTYALSTDAKYFFADNEDYAVAYFYDEDISEGCLQLVVPYYTVTVEANGHGSASADVTEGVSGTEVTLTVNADSGYEVDAINVIRGGVTVSDNKFTIGTEDVEIQVTFKETPPETYNIIVEDDGHGTAAASPNPATANAIVTLTATPNDGYAFEKWETVSGSVVITNNVFVMPASNVTVKAVFSEKMSSVITPPAANSLIYHGTTQTLVTPGAAQNGTMFYAIGEDSGTAPIKGWLKDIPTGKNAGTYCVWYKSVGDEGYADSIPECVEVIVSKAPLSIDTAVIADKVYDGTTTAQVTSVTFGGLLGDDRLAPGTDYSVSGVFDSPDYKGDHPATKVTVTVTLLATDAASNYRMTGPKDFEKTISAPADPTTPIIFPEEAHILVGQQATFTVQTTGEGLSYQWYINRNATGEGLSYQWYINRNDGRGWRKLKNATGTSYTTPVVDLDYDGFRYYCLVTDRYGNEVNSKIAVLHVSARPIPPKTGDSFRMILWLAMSMLSVLTILLIRRRETKD